MRGNTASAAREEHNHITSNYTLRRAQKDVGQDLGMAPISQHVPPTGARHHVAISVAPCTSDRASHREPDLVPLVLRGVHITHAPFRRSGLALQSQAQLANRFPSTTSREQEMRASRRWHCFCLPKHHLVNQGRMAGSTPASRIADIHPPYPWGPRKRPQGADPQNTVQTNIPSNSSSPRTSPSSPKAPSP